MAKVAEGMRQFTTQVPEKLLSGMTALAGKLGRSFSREVEDAFRRHLEAPPRLDAPALPPAGPVSRKGAAPSAPARGRPTRAELAIPGLKRGTELPARKKREETPEEPIVVRVVPDDDGPTVNAE